MILSGAKLFYPSAREWMWDYCIYLGPYTDEKTGRNYDLGIFLGDEDDDPSAAIVYGDEPGNYMSGCLSHDYGENRPFYLETIRRAKELKLMK